MSDKSSMLLKAAVAGRKLIRATAYVIKTETEEESPFFEALSLQGFEVHMKDLQVFSGGAKKADWDVGLAVDTTEHREADDEAQHAADREHRVGEQAVEQQVVEVGRRHADHQGGRGDEAVIGPEHCRPQPIESSIGFEIVCFSMSDRIA